MALVPRYLRIYDCPDKFTCDICYVDQKTGKEIMRYDGADPANTNPVYGAISDEECFSRKGLDKNEQIEESECVPTSTWQNRYAQICNDDDWDDYDTDWDDEDDYDPIKETESQIERMRLDAHRNITIETSVSSLEHRLRDLKARS